MNYDPKQPPRQIVIPNKDHHQMEPIAKQIHNHPTIIPGDIILEKQLIYTRHTLPDEYVYENTSRRFQWNKIKEQLARLENFQQHPAVWGVLQNRNNINGRPPRAKNSYTDNDFNETIDRYGIEDAQSAPLYTPGDLFIPERYGRDGTPVKLIQKEEKYTYAEVMGMEGHWQIPSGYIKTLPGGNSYPFKKVIFVDRTHQHVTALEKAGNKWLVRSMNPATTGIHRPPYRRKTPLGIFVLQEKKPRMFYLKDGSDQLEGFALYANRFTAGGYLHGVAVEFPQTEAVEFCSSLGSVPESHMCVRNATSHARFIYDWAPAGQSLICVIE